MVVIENRVKDSNFATHAAPQATFMPRTTIFIAAGEPSGDAHAARLMEQLRLLIPDVVFEGIGGPAMEMQGLRNMARMNDLAVSGFWEVAKRYGYFRALLQRCAQHLANRRPALFIPVDYPGFNLRLAAYARTANVSVAWYIAPQLWAWGRKRAAALAQRTSLLLTVFPFETDFFGSHGIRTTWVGHPLLDDATFATIPSHGGSTLALFPGSRRQELKHHIPLLLRLFPLLDTAITTTCAVAPGVDPGLLEPLERAGCYLATKPRELLSEAGAGLVKAGTSTLEATLLGLPYATFYRTSPLSYLLSRRMATISSVTMANILLRRNVVPEFLQSNATPQALAKAVHTLFTDMGHRQQLRDAALEVRELLGGPGASRRAAEAIATLLERRR